MDLREHWPMVVGAVVLVTGHAYLFWLGDAEWNPVSPPLLLAVIVVIFIEFGRSVVSHMQ